MIEKTLKAKSEKTREVQCAISYPENLQEAISLDGETNVFALYLGMRDIKVQNVMRRLTVAGKTDAEIQEFVKTMKIDAKIAIERDPVAATVADLKKMDPEQRKLKIAELMKQMKELNAAG
jgi:hypothetical protein